MNVALSLQEQTLENIGIENVLTSLTAIKIPKRKKLTILSDSEQWKYLDLVKQVSPNVAAKSSNKEQLKEAITFLNNLLSKKK